MPRALKRVAIARRVVLAAALAAAGCGSSTGTAGADLAIAPDLAPPTASVKGLILDESGAPLADVNVLCCSARECPFPVKSAADGSFTIGHLLLSQLTTAQG